jgi:hypothetical protein
MTTYYTTISVDLSHLDDAGDTGTLYADLPRNLVLPDDSVVYRQTLNFAVTAGLATITLPSTDATDPQNVPIRLWYVAADGKKTELGSILTPTTTATVTLGSLLSAGASTYQISPTNIAVDAGGIVLVPDLTWLGHTAGENGYRVLVKDVGIFRYDDPSTATADGETVVSTTAGDGLWAKEIWGGEVPSLSPLRVFRLEDYGAVGDGTTDCYAAFIAAAAAINANGSGCLYLTPGKTYYIGKYRITGGASANGVTDIIWSGLTGFHVVGWGAKISIKGDFNRAADASATTSYENQVVPFKLSSCQNVLIEGVEVDGNVDQMTHAAGVTEAPNHAIITNACSRVTIRDCNLHHMAADGIYLGASGTTTCHQVTLENVYSWANARNNITIAAARGVTCINCRIDGAGNTNAAGTSSGSYSGHSPQAGVDVEPNYIYPTVDVNCGEIVFIGCSFRNSRGQQFVSATAASNVSRVDSITLRDCYLLNGTSTSSQAAILTAKIFIAEGCIFDTTGSAGGVYPHWGSGADPRNTRTILRGCTFYAGDGSSGLTAALDTAGRGYWVDLDGCSFIGQQTVAITQEFPYIQSRYVRISNCYTWAPAAAHDGAGSTIFSLIQKCLAEGNAYNTDLATAGLYFQPSYSNNIRVSNERFVAGNAGTSDYFRPNGTWDTTYPYGAGWSNPGRLKLRENTATAGSAPINLTASNATFMTTPEQGAMEYDGTHLAFTPGATNREYVFTGAPPVTSTVNPGLIANGTTWVGAEIAVPGAALLDFVLVGAPAVIVNAGLTYGGTVTTAGNVKPWISNNTGGGVTPASASWKFTAIH